MNDDLSHPHSKPSEQPVFAVYQLKDGVQSSNHIDDYDMVAVISVQDTNQAAANICADSWHTLSEVTPLVDTPIRASTFGDVLGVPIKEGGYEMAQIAGSHDEGSRLEPFQFDESPRHQLEPESPKLVEAEKIRKSQDPGELQPEESPDKPTKPKI